MPVMERDMLKQLDILVLAKSVTLQENASIVEEQEDVKNVEEQVKYDKNKIFAGQFFDYMYKGVS